MTVNGETKWLMQLVAAFIAGVVAVFLTGYAQTARGEVATATKVDLLRADFETFKGHYREDQRELRRMIAELREALK